MNVLEDPKLKSLIIDRELSPNSIRDYKIIFTEFCEFIGKTPSELIEEAKQEQQPDWEKKRFLDIEERKITKYLKDYYKFLINEKHNKKSTIKNKMSKIRSFYGTEYGIKLPKPFKLDTKKTRARRTNIPNWEHVKTVVNKLENKKYIAMVYFLVTSGVRSGDLAQLTIGDFLDATKKYHNGTLEDLLSKDPYEYSIRPAWDFDPEKTDRWGNFCLTSNTPQAIKALFDYLDLRIRENEPVGRETALFRSEGNRTVYIDKFGFFDSSTISEIFKNEINPLLNTKDDEGYTVVMKDKHGYSFFRPHNLRKLFKTTCSAHLAKAMFEVEEKRPINKDIDILSLLTGHEPFNSQITSIYEAVDHEDIDPYYFHLIPYLTIGEIKAKDAHSDEFRELKSEIGEKDKRISKLEESNKEFNELFGDPEKLKKMKELLEK